MLDIGLIGIETIEYKPVARSYAQAQVYGDKIYRNYIISVFFLH